MNSYAMKLLRIFGLVLCLAFSALGFMGCHRAAPALPDAPAAKYFKTEFQDETRYLVESIVGDLAEMAAYARTKTVLGGLAVRAIERPHCSFGKPVYDIVVPAEGGQAPLRFSLNVNKPIWAPDLYEDIALQLCAPMNKAAPSAEVAPSGLAGELTELAAENLEKANRRVSELLTAHFQNPALHEQASLILGAFGLRDFAGTFYDARPILCRMTAHLALARALNRRQPFGTDGRLAEAILDTLMNNQRTALARIEGLSKDSALAPWVRALKAHVTGDDREISAVAAPTLLETIFWFEAVTRSTDIEMAWLKLGRTRQAMRTDYCRVVNQSPYTVGLGHQVREPSLALEIHELNQVYQLAHGRALAATGLVSALNTVPGGCFETDAAGATAVRILGWGQWAYFLQRHLCHTLQHNFDFLQRKWCVPEEAKKYTQEADRLFAGLRLYPVVRRLNAVTDAECQASLGPLAELVGETPHLVPRWGWIHLFRPFLKTEFDPELPDGHVNEWHRHDPPPGTAYEPGSAFAHRSLACRPEISQWVEALHEMAPYDTALDEAMVIYKFGKKPTFEQARELYRPRLEYASGLLARLAERTVDQPARYEEYMGKAADIHPRFFLDLGDYFAERGPEAKAAGYYERGNALYLDEVAVANRCGWLVDYYFRNQRVAEAEKLADRAAETYSGGGLRVKANLLFAQGKYAESFEYAGRVEERYHLPGEVVGWCVRYKDKTGSSQYDGEVKKRLDTLFPRGLERVTPAELRGRPQQGVAFDQESDLLRAAGLQKSNIVVAVNGVRVYDTFQYDYIRDQNPDPEMRLIVWDGKHYLEKVASPPNHRFGVPISSYVRGAARAR